MHRAPVSGARGVLGDLKKHGWLREEQCLQKLPRGRPLREPARHERVRGPRLSGQGFRPLRIRHLPACCSEQIGKGGSNPGRTALVGERVHSRSMRLRQQRARVESQVQQTGAERQRLRAGGIRSMQEAHLEFHAWWNR